MVGEFAVRFWDLVRQ